MRQRLRIILYLLVSLTIGIIATLAVDSFENIAVEKSIRKELEQEIRVAATAFEDSAGTSNPEALLRFLQDFSSKALSGKVVAIDPTRGRKPANGQFTFLFTFTAGNGRLDYYIVNSFLNEQLAILDPPELIFGLLTTVFVFAGVVFYTEKRKQVKELEQHFEVKHEEIRKVLEEHEALALLGRMAATLAHELKTPLATISNLLQVLPERLDDKKFTNRFIVLTKEELGRTHQLINNLLAYGKEIDARHAEWFPLAPLCSELAAKNALQIDAPAPWEVYGDRFYLGLLFDNLLRNSRTAGAECVRVAVQVNPAEDNGRVAILFEDNGSGFPADADLASLFSPFVTCRSSGAGLGLYLAGKIAAAHDGIITLYRPEQGAGVRISLPHSRVRMHEQA